MRIADNAEGRDVSVGTVVEPVSESLKPAIAHLWQLFSYDLSEFRGRPPDADGTYPMHGLPTFFVGDPARRTYVIRHNAVLAGFATVATDVGGLQHLDSFFVIRPLRR